MATKASVAWTGVIRQAIPAGVIAGVCFELYQWLTTVLPVHESITAQWQWIASAAIGPVAYANPAFAWLGLAFHFAASIGWAAGYAYFARLQPAVNARWYISGFFFGIVVQMFMTLLLLGAHTFVFPATPNTFLNEVLAHAVFFGIPLAFVVARLDQKP